jgi:hypothetical protein
MIATTKFSPLSLLREPIRKIEQRFADASRISIGMSNSTEIIGLVATEDSTAFWLRRSFSQTIRMDSKYHPSGSSGQKG